MAETICSESTQFQADEKDGGDESLSSKSTSAMDISAKREGLTIAKEEDRAVFQIRLAVAVFLFFCTTGVACIVYVNTRNKEQTHFRSDFKDFSRNVLGAFGNTLHQTVAAMDIYAVESASYVSATNLTWPFVVLPDSGTRLSKVLSVAKASIISIITVVSSTDREEWDKFSMEQGPAWVENNLRIQKNDSGFTGTQLDEYTISPLWSLDGIPQNQTRYFPVWQAYPTASSIAHAFNIDFQTKEAISFDLIESGVVLVSNVFNDPALDTRANFFLRDFVGSDLDVSEPFSDCYYPIFDDASDDLNPVQMESEMVAFLALTFHWRNQLLNTLPTGIEGLVLVVSTECNSTFTYEINGPDVNFLGYGDHHDPYYDEMVLESSLLDLLSLSSTFSSIVSHLPISQETCAYTFRIYPSKKFEDAYTSSDPWVYTSIAVGIFVFTSAVFWFYDTLVERRQRTVMSTAVKSSAIVSALFPSNVHDRLYNDDGTHGPSSPSTSTTMTTPKTPTPLLITKHLFSSKKSTITTKTATTTTTIDSDRDTFSQRDNIIRRASCPIADLFPETTVLFADIVQFTMWSSTREPTQVFLLLESVYGLFDKLAEKRGVFKIETIGDCYLAVAGLPDARSDHAVVMSKFASECCIQMSKLVSSSSTSSLSSSTLCETLGPVGTSDLSIRCGLNSGPVTAGVLRGQKTRFQLFGDTVNMASRMESTGEKNRIQASESTAKELIKHNKGHWLTTRPDRVHVKGKGSTVTYWVDPLKQAEVVVAAESSSNSPQQHSSMHGMMGSREEVPDDECIPTNQQCNDLV